MNTKLLEQLLGTALFEGETNETEEIEEAFDCWLNQQIEKYKFINEVNDRLTALEAMDIPQLPFDENQIKALIALANATLDKTPEKVDVVVSEPSEPVVTKIRRGRKPKAKVATENPVVVSDDDEYVDSTIPMRDPKTGGQMIDGNGKPMWLRVKKNPPKAVVPPNYKPPPPQHVANNMVMQEDGMNMGKAQGFKLPGTNLTFADLINNAKK